MHTFASSVPSHLMIFRMRLELLLSGLFVGGKLKREKKKSDRVSKSKDLSGFKRGPKQ